MNCETCGGEREAGFGCAQCLQTEVTALKLQLSAKEGYIADLEEQTKSLRGVVTEKNRLIEEWRKCGAALRDEMRERLAQEGLEMSGTPKSHYSPACNRLLELLRG